MAFEIVFRGDLVAGHNILEVKQALQTQFNLNQTSVEKMFSGKPVVLKKGLAEAEAEKFRDAFQHAGAQVQLREVSEPQPELMQAPATPQNEPVNSEKTDSSGGVDSGLELKPEGTPVLTEDERQPVQARDVDISGIALAPEGSDVLDDQDKRVYENMDIDTSHLDLEGQ